MRRGLTFIVASLALGSAADAKGPIDDWQGVYRHPLETGLVDGTTAPAVDVMEIVRVDPTHAYVGLDLNFANGHTCTFHGVFVEEGKQLIYRGYDDRLEPSKCILTVERYSNPQSVGLVIHDLGDGCRDTCGARAAFDGSRFPASLRDASEGALDTIRKSWGYQRVLAVQKPAPAQ